VLLGYKILTIRKNALFNYGHDPKDIANGDKAEYFALQSKTLFLSSEIQTSRKHPKESLTEFICGFMTGETVSHVV
jgi:hypothetical protein